MKKGEGHIAGDGSPRIRVGILRAARIRFQLSVPYLLTGSDESRPGSSDPWSGRGEARIRNGRIEVVQEGRRITSPRAASPRAASPRAASPGTAPAGGATPAGATSAGNLLFEPLEPDSAFFELFGVVIGIGFHWERKEDQKFRGALALEILDGLIQVINEIPLESYLASVISSEMHAGSPPEFLKAHAVISRSWLLAQMEKRDALAGDGTPRQGNRETGEELIRWYDREDHATFDVCADDHCQRYQGITRAYLPEVAEAARSTAGEVLLYGDDICDARFSKCCGGITERFESCWEEVPHPYLQPVQDRLETVGGAFPDLRVERNADAHIRGRPEAFCNTSDRELLGKVLNDYDLASKDFFRWEVSYSQEELAALIREKSGRDFGKILDLVPVERGASARLVRLKIVGTKKTITIGKELEIRRWLSRSHLYSAAFAVQREEFTDGVPGKFILHGAGWGHGVGLCQIGAAVMADRGYSYHRILLHYYRNATIRKCYE